MSGAADNRLDEAAARAPAGGVSAAVAAGSVGPAGAPGRVSGAAATGLARSALGRRAAEAWRALAPRERGAVAAAAAVVVLALLWSLALQPAWRTLARAPAELERLEADWQRMQSLAAEAQQLRNAAPVPPAAAQAALRAATERLAPRAQLTLLGERVVLRVDGVSPAELREWLAAARAGARARPVAATLERRAGSGGTEALAGSIELLLAGATP